MNIHSLTASFGRLQNETLTLGDGLNIIEAPNESGKSTWCAFLRTMLYGLSTRERGSLADKNRYAPWGGFAMRGRMELRADGADITLQRDTVRANSPMGHFSAVYTGTGESVPDLSGSNCGETLLGVPREVFERSAFIRQSGIAVDQDAELERRIAALITTGEDGASYSETLDRLKKQLNRRRHNKTGLIPALDDEIDEMQHQLDELHELTERRRRAEEALSSLRSEEGALRGDLALHDSADRADRFAALRRAKADWEQADAKTEVLYRMIEGAGTPPREMLDRARANLSALEELSTQRANAEIERRSSRDALDAFDRASHPAKRPFVPLIASSLLFAALLLFLLLHKFAFAAAAFVCAVSGAVLTVLRSRKARQADTQRAEQREALAKALREADVSCAALQSAYEAQSSAILADLPVDDIARAAAYVGEQASRYDMLSQLEGEAQRAQMAYELLQKQCEGVSASDETVARPARSRDELRSALERIAPLLAEQQHTVSFTDGRIRSIGDAVDLSAGAAEKVDRRSCLQCEYDALALAIDALDRANAALQNRFSPALSKRASEIFSFLTDGRYQDIFLDRSLAASAEAAGDPISRDAALLSQGAADQLFLAVRLAICDMVLPAEKNVPLILDDALTNFDDERCQRALDLLAHEGHRRQILLFTCQHREAAYLGERSGVIVLPLPQQS